MKMPAKVINKIHINKLNLKIMETLIINYKKCPITSVITKDEKNLKIYEKHYYNGTIYEEIIRYCQDSEDLKNKFERDIRAFGNQRDKNECTLITCEL